MKSKRQCSVNCFNTQPVISSGHANDFFLNIFWRQSKLIIWRETGELSIETELVTYIWINNIKQKVYSDKDLNI